MAAMMVFGVTVPSHNCSALAGGKTGFPCNKNEVKTKIIYLCELRMNLHIIHRTSTIHLQYNKIQYSKYKNL